MANGKECYREEREDSVLFSFASTMAWGRGQMDGQDKGSTGGGKMIVYILIDEHYDMDPFEFLGIFKTEKLAWEYSEKYKKRVDEHNKKWNYGENDAMRHRYHPVVKAFRVRTTSRNVRGRYDE